MHAIASRGIHIIGTEGAHPSWTGLEPWGRPLPGAGKPASPSRFRNGSGNPPGTFRGTQ